MREQRTFPTRLLVCLLLTVLLLPLAARPAAAQNLVVVRGLVVDTAKQPVAGYRVVFRVADAAEVYLSTPTDEKAEYAVSLPEHQQFKIVAVITPGGARLAQDPVQEFTAQAGTRRNVIVDLSELQVEERDIVQFAGADRLFLSFVEDTAMAENWRIEGQIGFASQDPGDPVGAQLVGMVQFDAIPRIEFGGRIGYLGADTPADVPDGNGLSDTDLWAKFYLGPRWMRHSEYSFGGLVTLPTGNQDNLQSFDALRSKLFFAMRYSFPSVILSANAGVRFNASGDLHGIPLEGKTAGSLGVAAIVPIGAKFAVIGELTYEGERFEGSEADSRLLAGVNWKALPWGVVRFAVGGGLTDGAPDAQFVAGWSFDF
jgi:hypothetical protein